MIRGVEVKGLAEFSRRLKTASPVLAVEMKQGLNAIASTVAQTAASRVPRRSGRLAGSLRATSTPKVGKVTAGSKAVPYAGWIEYGGAVGVNKTNVRPRVPQGRYLRPAYEANAARVEAEMVKLVDRIAEKLD